MACGVTAAGFPLPPGQGEGEEYAARRAGSAIIRTALFGYLIPNPYNP